ncbi:hypothetical protein FPQ18DRAFT_362503 [Pyronema domesticum]|uniref:Uncharacterized protein n=1 Tax=Pyronema omphalodes (strain CBS 100304) TaxID=1076935 RepID=U4L5V0_PYROM|nr:hypothetical protein FPQ18DRAFT_362503 [Pyronema domesticum]CCX07806.1 Similar to hypothetical protein [Tuber melanosporum Mel28]; acc. no. XP_002835623 [Pyronema omphalodes CBS 100304]
MKLFAFLLPAIAMAYKPSLEIHVMSQCPDAAYCFKHLIQPTLSSVGSLVKFTQSFIGTVTESGVACKHGPSECLGNMLHLCGDNIGFSGCLFEDYEKVTQKEFVKSCAEKNGLDFENINQCASDIGEDGGLQRLERSVDRSDKAGVRISCTVRLEGKTVCVRDGDEWKNCPGGHKVEDLVKQVKEANKRGNRQTLDGAFRKFRDEGKINWIEL